MLLGIVDRPGGGWDPPVRSKGCSVGPCVFLIQPDPLHHPDPTPTRTINPLRLVWVVLACSLVLLASCYTVFKTVQPPNFIFLHQYFTHTTKSRPANSKLCTLKSLTTARDCVLKLSYYGILVEIVIL
jgi:hypothetical protein